MEAPWSVARMRNAAVFEVLLLDADKPWPDALQAIDEISDDDELVDLVDAALRGRHPLSGRRWRFGTPATVMLRMFLLKHPRPWAFSRNRRTTGRIWRRGGRGCSAVP